MITSATIENFKCFKELHLPDLSRITLLGGRNNVGKSSVLEALFLFYAKQEPDMFFRHFGWRGISLISPEAEEAVAPAFRDYMMNRAIVITVSEDNFKETMEVAVNFSQVQKSIELQFPENEEKNPQVRIDQKTFPSYALEITYKSENEKARKSQVIFQSNRINMTADLAEAKLYPVAYIGARARFNPKDVAKRFGSLDVVGKGNTVVEFLQILEPRLTSLSSVVTETTSSVYGEIGIGRKIPVAFMGEGMDRLLSIILAIATSKNGFVLIDEFENGVHHSVMSEVWQAISKAAKEYNVQVIATTHSYECLQAAFEGTSNAGLSNEFRYIRLDRADEDIVARTYSHSMLGAAIERGWEVR